MRNIKITKTDLKTRCMGTYLESQGRGIKNHKIGMLSGCASGTEEGIDRFKSSSGKRKGSEK